LPASCHEEGVRVFLRVRHPHQRSPKAVLLHRAP